ncbi:MAG: hypothetical protein WCN98_20940, partial [Verrucomicrobiaceae bacterium]
AIPARPLPGAQVRHLWRRSSGAGRLPAGGDAMRLLKLQLVLFACAARPAPAILIIVGIQAGQIGGMMHVSPSWKA